MKHKFLILTWLLSSFLILLFLLPNYISFSFEEKIEKPETIKFTNFSISEIEEIDNFLKNIDETKISDENLKKSFTDIKKSLENDKNILIAEKQKIEEEKKKLALEEEQKKLEQEKNMIYPKEFDITKNLAKLHIQERNLSCEAAATTDILSTILKKDILEKDILEMMKKDLTYWKPSYKNSEWKLIWWDPDNWFVWEMDWHQFNLTGFAIHEKPLSEIYKKYDVKFATYNMIENDLGIKDTKEALTYMLKELVKWNYVQMWWDYCTDQNFEDWNTDKKITTKEANSGLSQKNYCYSFFQERKITWYTEDWKEVKAWKQSHNFILLGYIWDIENPEKIIIWDTQTWRHVYPTSEWLRKWELNDARAIIAYKN